MNEDTLISVSGLKTWFPVTSGKMFGQPRFVHAVDNVDFSICRGKTLGLVGESGSGKTTVGRTILRLISATSGRVIFDSMDVFSLRGRQLNALRKRMQIIFQDPMSSLNPRMTVESIISEPLLVHFRLNRKERKFRVADLLEKVGLPSSYMNRYPHEFSGGQRQRIGIARALASSPDFIVCDEPVSALDVSIQAQILNLLSDLQQEMGLSYLFIAHNLAVVEHFADEIAVMYLGRIVEKASPDDLYSSPLHPYTQALLSAIPVPDPSKTVQRTKLPGETPSPVSPPKGCPFHPRCLYTRQCASGMNEKDTSPVITGGEVVRVAKACISEVPVLRPSENNPAHCHACILRQTVQ
jgi:oligopeptide transport system ATP-binding protein